jgi:type I site-specific restriction endonuclease
MAQQLEQRQGEEPKDASELMPESEAGQEDLGYSALPSDAYEEEEWETQKQKVWPHQIHVFGMRQNQINRRYSAWIRTLEIQNRALEIRVQRLEEELAEQKKELERQKEKEVESLGRMVLDIENMKREFRKFYQLAESLTGMQNDLNQFRKVVSDVRQMKTAMSQLQVSAKLNGNAVARIMQQMQEQEPEPDSTEDSAES